MGEAGGIATAVTVRAAGPADDAQVAAIWNHEVQWTSNTTATERRGLGAQREWRHRHGTAHPVVVIAAGERVLGFGALSPYRPGPAFRTTVEDSVYVSRGSRGQGLGERLLAELLSLGRERGYRSVMARITAGNVPSRRLHEGHGFALVGVEREPAFKLGRWHDVVIMQRLI